VRALLQRVSRAEVRVGGAVVGRIGNGLLVFVGVGPADTEAVAADLARRCAELRIFRDADGRSNMSLIDVGAERLYLSFAAALGALLGRDVPTGRFGNEMEVELVNDGPYTIWLDTEDR
jgi:D-tyrosyl-tRNA(Tyr) deacylase